MPGTSCRFANGNIGDPRVCKKLAKAGEVCGLSADCEKTAFCEAATDTCKNFVAVGGACSTADSSCADALPCLNGKCSARAALGAACDFATECESGHCHENTCVDGNLYCF